MKWQRFRFIETPRTGKGHTSLGENCSAAIKPKTADLAANIDFD
jgi:hypothetical protein